MSDPITGTSIYLMPGMSVKLKSPINSRNNFGWFVATEIPRGHFDDLSYVGEITRGFVVEDTRNGTLIPAPDETAAAVIYTHKRLSTNAIWFFALSGERGLVNVISVPIHDHSTIVHGGPAYGTYFDDDIER
jgi:hypothetical protein